MVNKEQAAELLWHGLNDCSALDKPVAVATVTHWLEHHGAGYPEVPLMLERVRDDARFWAACATQVELEAYAVAAIMALTESAITGGAAKRLAALGWQRMTDDDKERFKVWIGKQGETTNG